MTNKPSRIKTNKKESINSVVVLNDPAQISFPTKYDTKELQSFLDFVFHGIKPEDTESQVLLWKCKTHIPGYPSEEESVLRQLDRTNKPLALYYGTSSCVVDTDGKLYNKKALFKQLHVVVLDDIGTKIPEASLPKGLEPSYIVESSEGNFQYGFVLETPIDVLEHATALIHLVYGSGYSDTGGGMPTKAVRLPGGVNGKAGTPKQNFLVNLRKTNGPRWTPEKLLEVLEIDVTWDYVKENTKVILNRNVGTSAWSPIAAQAASMTGVIDPVLEWLYDNNLVKSENDEWVTFECPWSHNHSSGDEAGYSPLGRGKGVQAEYRGYHCFHDACNGTDQKTIYDLLQHVAANGGPEAAVHDPAAKLVSEWAYDSSSDSVWQVRASHQPRSISMQAFKHTYPNKLRVVNAEGKTKMVAETALWFTSPSRVIVHGRTFDPTSDSKLIKNQGDLLVNMFYHPEWGDGAYDKKDVAMFKQFIEYLVPAKEERDYFMQWLAAKCQNLGFRGAALLMIAKQQGTGRTTLSDMLETLMGTENVENVPFNRLTGDGVFNEWMEKPLVVTNETKDTSDTKSYYKVYEGLKEYIDPRPKRERINPKYGQQRISMVHSSYIMFSNHDNALAVAGNDRRFYVMRNASVPADPSFFGKLNTWLQVKDDNGTTKWARSVWRWLQEQKIDMEALLSPAPLTTSKIAMMNATKNPLTVSIETIIDMWPGDFVATYKIKAVLDRMAVRLGANAINNYEAQIRAIVAAKTETVGRGGVVKIENKTVVPKIKVTSLAKAGYAERFITQELSSADRSIIRNEVSNLDIEGMVVHVNAALDMLES